MRTYVIIPVQDAIDYSQICETAAGGLVRSLDGTKEVVKFTGDTPPFLAGKTQYTRAEIGAVLAGPEWLPSEPPE